MTWKAHKEKLPWDFPVIGLSSFLCVEEKMNMLERKQFHNPLFQAIWERKDTELTEWRKWLFYNNNLISICAYLRTNILKQVGTIFKIF